MDRCDQCGFVYDEVSVADIPFRLRASEGLYRAVLLAAGPGPVDGGATDAGAGPAASSNPGGHTRPGSSPDPIERDEILLRRPQPDVWSALEYACHVRDVLLVQRDRAVVALVETNPGFARMHREERVGLARYDAHPPPQVVDQLGVAAELCATLFGGLTAEQWARPLIYNYPAPMPRNLAWLARNTVHEVVHHLGDIRAVIAAVTPTSPA